MNTPVSHRRPQTVFRRNYRPKVVKTQHDLSSLLITPDFAPELPIVNNESTLRTPGDKPKLLFSALDRTGWSHRVEYAVNEIIRDQSECQKDKSVQGDINRMFEATMSTVVLIASGDSNVSEEHLLWSEAFLRGIRDSYGNHPPNVRKMLGFIKHLQDSLSKRNEITRNGDSGDVSELLVRTYRDHMPANVTLTKVPPPTTV
ncbi:uncharacterized protein LOC131433661 [Malaya genurostris]|uniref:uncharacterized protein LOC131433661 n=1 Tax=Malaya genurostris TaxID=325434 RepID=UPI0026F3854B|nr:uncharacterized protein LOC131433661 [Malaya genurostris]